MPIVSQGSNATVTLAAGERLKLDNGITNTARIEASTVPGYTAGTVLANNCHGVGVYGPWGAGNVVVGAVAGSVTYTVLSETAFTNGGAVNWSDSTGTALTKPDGSTVTVVPASRTVNGYALTANVTLTADDIAIVPYDPPSTVIDVTKATNIINLTAASMEFTFSATPANGAVVELSINGYTAACTATIPQCYDIGKQANITSIVFPANWKGSVYLIGTAAATRIDGVPVASESAAESIASAATTNLATTLSRQVNVTGATDITSFGTVAAGTVRYGYFSGALKVTASASLIIPGLASGQSVKVKAGDHFTAEASATDVWRFTFIRGVAPAYYEDTWANIRTLTPAERALGFATDIGDFGTEVEYLPGAGWGPRGGKQLIFSSNVVATRNSDNGTDATSQYFISKTIKANMFGSNGGIDVVYDCSHTSGGSACNNAMQYGGVGAGTSLIGTGTGARGFWRARGNNATGTHKSTASAGLTWGSGTGATQFTADSTVDQVVRLEQHWAANNVGGVFTLQNWEIWWVGRGN